MDLFEYWYFQLVNGESWKPVFGESKKYKTWVAILDLKTCAECRNNHGKIWAIEEVPEDKPPLHPNCRCVIINMTTIESGTATINGKNGADWYLKFYGVLPDCYIDKTQAYQSGWEEGKWVSSFAPDKMIAYGIFKNNNGHLPQASNRIWYEADINYKTGKRNSQRILWSNDGLIFVTFDHYKTFFEIV